MNQIWWLNLTDWHTFYASQTQNRHRGAKISETFGKTTRKESEFKDTMKKRTYCVCVVCSLPTSWTLKKLNFDEKSVLNLPSDFGFESSFLVLTARCEMRVFVSRAKRGLFDELFFEKAWIFARGTNRIFLSNAPKCRLTARKPAIYLAILEWSSCHKCMFSAPKQVISLVVLELVTLV
jgi:hypothetical protein